MILLEAGILVTKVRNQTKPVEKVHEQTGGEHKPGFTARVCCPSNFVFVVLDAVYVVIQSLLSIRLSLTLSSFKKSLKSFNI